MAKTQPKGRPAGMQKAGAENGAKRSGPPAGMRRVSASAAPWFLKGEGKICFGEVQGRHEMRGNDGKPRAYYQVRVKQACEATVGSGKDAEVVEVEVGGIVNLNENFKLAVLKDEALPIIKAGGAVDVWAEFQDKIEIGGGQTMWNIDVYIDVTKAPTRPVQADGEEGEAAPF